MHHKSHGPAASAPHPALVKVCIRTVVSAEGVEQAGADRIELRSVLEVGGTPGAGLLPAVRVRVRIPRHILVRPRAGHFGSRSDELEVIAGEVRETRRAFDQFRDQSRAFEDLTDHGVARVLTSRGAGSAGEGIPVLARPVRASPLARSSFSRAAGSGRLMWCVPWPTQA